MILGVYRMVTVQLWQWLYRFIVDTLGPVTIRLARVTGLACLWLLIVFGPLWIRLPWWLDLTWLGLSIGGSVWGLYRIVRKPKIRVEVQLREERR
jgi:hypothetical protein